MEEFPGASTPSEPGSNRATPVMSQYLALKEANPGYLLFYRMGDFYELFFADAETAAGDLGIALTKRGKHLGQDIPMCGVPVHAADSYLQRLIRKGHRVAVCEQLEDPSEARRRGSKSVMRRGVVRLVTAGTLTEDSLLEPRNNNFLAAVVRIKSTAEMALAWTDISSGELTVAATSIDKLTDDLTGLDCREIVVSESLLSADNIGRCLDNAGAPVTPLPDNHFNSLTAERKLLDFFGVVSLDAFGHFSTAQIAALGGLIGYISITQVGRMPPLRRPQRVDTSQTLLIDAATRKNLELTRASGEERGSSLLSVIDFTVTAGGSRCLARRLSMPLVSSTAINARLDDIQFIRDQPNLLPRIRGILAEMPDLERALSRLSLGRGSPKDLQIIALGLSIALRLADLLNSVRVLDDLPNNLRTHGASLGLANEQLSARITSALIEEPSAAFKEGGFIRPGYYPDLDECRSLRDASRQVIASLQRKYVDLTGVKGLKLKHNNFLGYFVEVAAANAAALLTGDCSAMFVHRQTVANAMRFTTAEVGSLQERIAEAASRGLAIEMEIFADLSRAVIDQTAAIGSVAQAIAEIDASSALSEAANRLRYVRPQVDDSGVFDVRAGRHPVVEKSMREAAGAPFVTNDCALSADGERVWLVTGPNMAGKSTFLRQNALIIVLAQIGSYVPADFAHIGVVDRLFSRVGASDDLARGRSTFMVEMVETAAILNQATPRSFVILDEVGRGTATFDGLSIAWATIEHLHDSNRCRALFATHYHELTALSARLDRLANVTVKVREWNQKVIFLHQVVPGIADRSYGIHVATLAGLPRSVVSRAREVLSTLEHADGSAVANAALEDLPLFASNAEPPPQQATAAMAVLEQIRAADPDTMAPRQALDFIYMLKTSLEEAS